MNSITIRTPSFQNLISNVIPCGGRRGVEGAEDGNLLGKVVVLCLGHRNYTLSLNLEPTGTCSEDIRSHQKLPLQKWIGKPQVGKKFLIHIPDKRLHSSPSIWQRNIYLSKKLFQINNKKRNKNNSI